MSAHSFFTERLFCEAKIHANQTLFLCLVCQWNQPHSTAMILFPCTQPIAITNLHYCMKQQKIGKTTVDQLCGPVQ